MSQFGAPTFIVSLTANEEDIKKRYCKDKEVDEVPEEGQEEFKQKADADEELKEGLIAATASNALRIQTLNLNTS